MRREPSHALILPPLSRSLSPPALSRFLPFHLSDKHPVALIRGFSPCHPHNGSVLHHWLGMRTPSPHAHTHTHMHHFFLSLFTHCVSHNAAVKEKWDPSPTALAKRSQGGAQGVDTKVSRVTSGPEGGRVMFSRVVWVWTIGLPDTWGEKMHGEEGRYEWPVCHSVLRSTHREMGGGWCVGEDGILLLKTSPSVLKYEVLGKALVY